LDQSCVFTGELTIAGSAGFAICVPEFKENELKGPAVGKSSQYAFFQRLFRPMTPIDCQQELRASNTSKQPVTVQGSSPYSITVARSI
jgi:hypothetical protein